MNAVSVQYGDKDFFVVDSWQDSISINSDLLSSLGDKWIPRIVKLLEKTDKMVYALGNLASDIAVASGDSGGLPSKRKSAREEAYYNLDMPFRKWLTSISPGTDDHPDEACDMWDKTACAIILGIGKEMFSQAGTQAFVGRKIDGKLYTAPQVYTKFRNYVYWILQENKEESRKGNESE